MKLHPILFLLALLAFAQGPTPVTASIQLLANPGFEDPINTMGSPPFFGRWTAFSSSSGVASSTTRPRSGQQHLELNLFSENEFAGVFQEVIGLAPGDLVTYSGWHASDLGVPVTEIRIEWRDSVADAEVARTVNFTAEPGFAYETFSLDFVVPGGADSARAVYAIQSFGGSPDQSVYVDDLSFLVSREVDSLAPEPTLSAVLAGFGAGTLVCCRRRVSR